MVNGPHSKPPQIAVYILAGGQSTRMGKQKARLRLGNRTLLGHAKAAAVASGLKVRVLREDLVPRCGPLGGVYTALATTGADDVLFLACDMPFVSTALMLRVVAAHKRSGRAVFVKSDAQAGFPCIIPKTCLPAIEKQMARKEWSLQRLSQVIGARLLRLSGQSALEVFNVNTGEDFGRARQIWHGLSAGSYRRRRATSS